MTPHDQLTRACKRLDQMMTDAGLPITVLPPTTPDQAVRHGCKRLDDLDNMMVDQHQQTRRERPVPASVISIFAERRKRRGDRFF